MCKILVIDDEKFIVNMLQEVLEKYGHDVETAADGQEGIEKFDGDCFDMVITDMLMPGVDGNGVVQHIRSSYRKDIPVIGISGTPWMLEESGFDSVIKKPFPLKTLIDSVKELVPGNSKIVALV